MGDESAEKRDSDLEDQRLMAKAQGDRNAFDQLFNKHRDYLIRYFTKTIGNQEEAKDVVMRAFEKAWSNRDQYQVRDKGTVLGWLHTIANRIYIDDVRRKNKNTSHDASGDVEVEDPSPSFEAKVLDAEVWNTIDRMLKENLQLPDDIIIIRLHYKLGLPITEVAYILDMNLNTVKSRIQRNKSIIREIMQKLGYKF